MKFILEKLFNFNSSIISLTFITSLLSIIIIILNFFWIITTINEITIIWRQFDNEIDEIKNVGSVQWSELNSFTVTATRDVKENYRQFVKRYTEETKKKHEKHNNRNRDYAEPDETYPTAPNMPINEYINEKTNEIPTTKPKYSNPKVSYEGHMLSKVVRIQSKKNNCACSNIPNLCKKGLPGIPGRKGMNGYDGVPGIAGVPGFNALSSIDVCQTMQVGCISCPPGKPGSPGVQGKRGLKGLEGRNGTPGCPGKHGIPGSPGDQGDLGLIGYVGTEGIQGLPGNNGYVIKSKPGPPGLKGPIGVAGLQGDDGDEGIPGKMGDIGLQGLPGLPGSPGAVGVDGKPGEIGNVGSPGQYCPCPGKSTDNISPTNVKSSNQRQTINVQEYNENFNGMNNGMNNGNTNVNMPNIENNNQNSGYNINKSLNYTVINDKTQSFQPNASSIIPDYNNTQITNQQFNNGMSSQNITQTQIITETIFNPYKNVNTNSNKFTDNKDLNISTTLSETISENEKSQYLSGNMYNNSNLSENNNNNNMNKEDNSTNKEYLNKVVIDTSQSSMHNSQLSPVQESISRSQNTETEVLNTSYQNSPNPSVNIDEVGGNVSPGDNQNNYNKESSQQVSMITNTNENNANFIKGTGIINNNEFEVNGNNGKQTIIQKTIITETINSGYPGEEYKLINEPKSLNLTMQNKITNEIPSQSGYSKITLSGYQTNESKNNNQNNNNNAPIPYQLQSTNPTENVVHPPAIPQPNSFVEFNSGLSNSSYYSSRTSENINKPLLGNSETITVTNYNQENITQQIQPSQISHEENNEYEKDFVPESSNDKRIDSINEQLKNNKTYEAIKILESPTGEFSKSSNEKIILSSTDNPSIKDIHHIATSTFDNSPVERSKVNIGFLPQIKLIPYQNYNTTGVNNTIIRETITVETSETTKNNENKFDLKQLGPKIRLDKVAISYKKPGLIDGQAKKSFEKNNQNISLLHEEKVSERARDSVDNKVLPEKIIQANYDLLKSLRKEQSNGDLNININGPNKIFIKAKDSIESLTESNFNPKSIQKHEENDNGYEIFASLRDSPHSKNVDFDISNYKKIISGSKSLIPNLNVSIKNMDNVEENLEKRNKSEEFNLTQENDKNIKLKFKSDKSKVDLIKNLSSKDNDVKNEFTNKSN
ncbi:Hypothetical protein SRAE_0000036900 [Strongyloides ratti]|uniref:Collagen triple helix repeat-containing protein n=1 Tax=Strongyloides ratti TaxID=34506 RepID=A0A090MSL0_STRRB|nr:Hypothetical protein SRAE_0000036900 [Strongyloides ratti]CEF61243.1 Hypothetical protein SRAE_0000036900 [Strongyloides ratti]